MGDYTVSLLVSGPDIGPDTETKTEYIHVTGVEIDHVLPDTGLCREVMTVNGSGFGGAQDVIDGDVGDYKVVQVVGASGTYTAAAYCCWSDSQFRFLFGDMFSDEDQDFIRDATEPCYRQCEDFSIGQYAVYVKNIHYQDVDNSNTYSQGDLIEEVTPGGAADFVLDSGLAVYVIDPGQVERSHYCPSGELVTSVVRIYGWGFGDTQGDSKVYIGTGGMWSSDTGLELGRTIWSDLMIKAAVDVPLGAKGMTLYIWVEKDGVKTDDKYGYPGVYILPTETCP
jgi:PKD repeat protein